MVPVTPGEITTSYNGQNKTINLIDGSEINQLNPPGLTTYEMKLLIPKRIDYPFANKLQTLNGETNHYEQDHYLLFFSEQFKYSHVMTMIIWRTDIGGGMDMGVEKSIDVKGDGIITCKTVTIESYKVKEDAEEGLDVYVELKLKEYVPYGTKTYKYTQDDATGTVTATEDKTRSDTKDVADTYTVKSGDCLSSIAKKELGDANKWKDLQKLNNLVNANKIYPGQVLRLK